MGRRIFAMGSFLLLFNVVSYACRNPLQGLPGAQVCLLHTINPVAGDWVLGQTVNNVEFYYKIAECNGKKVVLLKLNNKNSYKVKISWKEVFTTQMEQQAEGHFGKKELTVAPGEVYAGECTGSIHKELLILPTGVSPAYSADIQKFAYKDISVTKN
jgi:hypothetical protein